jgi:predicted transglutaminase-like cysteine proteinase
MSNLRHALRTVALSAAGFGLGLFWLFNSGLTKAEERSAPVEATFQTARLEFPEMTAPSGAERPGLQPFGYTSSGPLMSGGIHNKWQTAKTMLRIEDKILQYCRADLETCPPAAKLYLNIISNALARDARARIGEINRAINATIKPADDLTVYGVQDFWATPLISLAMRTGDCDDYAIAKYAALRDIGFASSDLRLVIVQDNEAHQTHAVTAVRFEGRWLVLDNLRHIVQEDTAISRFTPLYFIDEDGVKSAIAPSLENPGPMVRPLPTASLDG